MSADNVEIVHELLDAWLASGTDAVAARFLGAMSRTRTIPPGPITEPYPAERQW